MNYRTKIKNYYREHGARGAALRVVEKLTGWRPGTISYETWIAQNDPGKEELARQRGEHFQREPKFSIVVPLYRTDESYLRELVDSVKQQTYGNWELCLSDGSGPDSPLTGLLKKLEEEEERICVTASGKTLGISDNTNAAIAMATGEYLVFADHDDLLAPDALYACAEALQKNNKIDVLYSDEDKISMGGKRRYDPQFKPDLNLELLRSVNYICHLFVVERKLADRVGYLDAAYDGAQDYDFILRCVEQAGEVCHIPRILYHWRCHAGSTAENQESKAYAFEAGKRAIEAHLRRQQVKATVEQGEYLGLYRVCYQVKDRPKISILIPNKDHGEDLRRCVDSIRKKNTWPNLEILIIENNSTDEETFSLYEKLREEDERIRLVTYEGTFNYSAINNLGAREAKGEYLLLLNNDTECISEELLEEMVSVCSQPHVGGVGARLYYGDDTIQHAGVILGLGGIAGHGFAGERRSATGYCRRIICRQELSAVTAACMMVKREAFDAVGGFDEELEVTFNDVDLCMRIRGAGYRIIYDPYAELYHYESKSRGEENTPEKVERFHREIRYFQERWRKELEKGDPFYSPCLTRKKTDFSLRDQRVEPRIWTEMKV